MKNTFHIFLFLLTFLALFSACKNPSIDYDTFAISEESVMASAHDAKISGSYTFTGEVTGMKLNVGLNDQLADAESYPMHVENTTFDGSVDNLEAGTLYYYCFVVEFGSNHKKLTDIGSFTTLSEKPKVRTLKVIALSDLSYQVKGIVDDDGGSNITERGVCWNQTGNPQINSSSSFVACPTNGIGEFNCQIDGLELSSTYYVRAYAKNEKGIAYANEVLSFETGTFEKPIIETEPVSGITQTSAICGGKIISEGSSPVTQYGICWGTSPNLDINGEHTSSQSNETEFSVTLTDLSPSTLYYICAYAINNEGIGYGETIGFSTLVPNLYNIEVSCQPAEGGTAEGGGAFAEGSQQTVKATANAHYVFQNWTENGTEVSTSAEYTFVVDRNRTLIANFAIKQYHIGATANPSSGGTVSGIGDYDYGHSCTLTANANAGYKFVYWTENDNLVTADASYSFTVTGNRTFVAHFVELLPVPEGAINGLFSISGTKKVFFSRGNLQYNAHTKTWQFAPHQYDVIGYGNENISETYNGWIDLFGWATSGYHNPSDPNNVNYHPWSSSQELLGYGPYSASGELTGNLANYDWGINNPISNGGSQPNLWRTLSKEEWNHLFNERTDASSKYGSATVVGVSGVVILPDDWTLPLGLTFNSGMAGWNHNSYDATQWAAMDAAGAVFLPAAGKRYGPEVSELVNIGHYWSVTFNNLSTAYELTYNQNSLQLDTHNRCDGLSVRLVCPYR